MRLELDDFVIDDAASNVLNDPLGALIETFRFSLAPVSRDSRVCLWLEPEGYAIDVLGASFETRAVLRVYYDRDFVPPMQNRQMSVRFECELDRKILSSALAVGLAALLDDPQAGALDSWRRHESLESYRARFDSAQGRLPRSAGLA